MKRDSALVVFSGGQDSTTCLYWALREFSEVSSLTFDYDQRHRMELEAAAKIAELAAVPNSIIKLGGFSDIGGNALTDDIDVNSALQENNLPNTFVPGRNIIFLSYAAAYAYSHKIQDIVLGVCQTDYSGYPDCRQETINATLKALNLGMDADFRVHTPLMNLTKAESISLACEVGAQEALAWSHTCYNGTFPPCGDCAACKLRAKGFAKAGIADPLLKRT